jgi:hypothetical protein
MKTRSCLMKGRTLAFLALVALPAVVLATDDPQISGVFGLTPVAEATALALWVPVADGSAVAGIRWFNNDGTLAWPEILAVAGGIEEPEQLAAATVVGSDVEAGSSSWAEYTFDQPLASQTAGFFLIFVLPEGGDFEHAGEGGGAALGYTAGDGVQRCWVTADGQAWSPFAPQFQLAVEPVAAGDKSAEVLVLRRPGDAAGQAPSAGSSAMPAMVQLTCRPNPFNPQTEIRFTLPQAAAATLGIYDVRGQRVWQLQAGELAAGEHGLVWQGRDESGRALPSGVYMARLTAGPWQATQRLTLVQ